MGLAGLKVFPVLCTASMVLTRQDAPSALHLLEPKEDKSPRGMTHLRTRRCGARLRRNALSAVPIAGSSRV